ncbi:hypothetical protein [Vibrio harveyi]|uniref:hypothetical protein n=1 Tax=Vibrio harveyi TaxID=669 RepID=UPI000AB21D56|nr:hypothetical protein [Vibrio harveyi]
MNDVKVPSLQDYLYHTGLHYKKLWAEVGNDWKCPACSRTKFQIMRWTKRFPNKPTAFMDWVAALHRHHDHSADILNPQNARFSETVICGQCNSADGAVKRKLKLPKDFSFSPVEISKFVSATPHGAHKISYELAESIYHSLKGTI